MTVEPSYKCKQCTFFIVLLGAHRGGVYCDNVVYDNPKVINILPKECAHFLFDNGQPHRPRFPLQCYPGLLSTKELEESQNARTFLI